MIELFHQHNPATNYAVGSLEEFYQLPQELWPLYTVTETVLVKAIPVHDNGEALIDLDTLIQQRGSQIHLAVGTTATGSTNYALQLRSEAAKRLLQAEQVVLQLSHGQYSLSLTDAYRPIAVQRQHFNSIREQLRQTGLSGDDLYQKTLVLISDPDLVPPHSLGGTVDLTLYDLTTGQSPFMGTVVDAIDTPLIYTWHSAITDPAIRWRRTVLYNAMVQAGFCNYPYEWWHYSYGDQRWALEHQQPSTLYAPL